jgi:hypothetical protein
MVAVSLLEASLRRYVMAEIAALPRVLSAL